MSHTTGCVFFPTLMTQLVDLLSLILQRCWVDDIFVLILVCATKNATNWVKMRLDRVAHEKLQIGLWTQTLCSHSPHAITIQNLVHNHGQKRIFFGRGFSWLHAQGLSRGSHCFYTWFLPLCYDHKNFVVYIISNVAWYHYHDQLFI